MSESAMVTLKALIPSKALQFDHDFSSIAPWPIQNPSNAAIVAGNYRSLTPPPTTLFCVVGAEKKEIGRTKALKILLPKTRSNLGAGVFRFYSLLSILAHQPNMRPQFIDLRP